MESGPNTVGRNAPCPCGSGRRYKDCHGALPTDASPRDAATTANRVAAAWIPQALQEALAAQNEGRVTHAVRKYRDVLAADPENFNATHMLGLVEYEVGHYDEALALINRAIELRPELRAPRQNLRLLQALPVMEEELCREILGRFVARTDTAFETRRLGAGGAVHVVSTFGDAERDALAVIAAAAGPAMKLWQETGTPALGVQSRPLGAEQRPEGGVVVLLGATSPVSAWLGAANAEAALVVVTRDNPCAIIDRLDELAAEGYARPGLLCASASLARRMGLPSTAVWREIASPARS
jgi:tetratricopeptide (TPR) repeat protein